MANKMILPFLILLCFVLLNFNERFARTGSIITSDSSITAGSNKSLVSPSGDFAFGFYPLPNNLYLVGIWFDKIPQKTLVWSANRDNPAPANSVVQLNGTGQFVLSFPNGGIIQSIFTEQHAPAISGQMQNDGNFVLKDSNSVVIGQSFDFPTDTLLLGQILRVDKKMFSANNISDFSTGKFMLQMRKNGNLVLSNTIEDFYNFGYWFRVHGNIPNTVLVFNKTSALMYLTKQTNPNGLEQRFRNLTLSVPTPIQDYYHRATIDVDGEFRQYVYSKIKGMEWREVWGAMSDDSCLSNKTVACDCVWRLFHFTQHFV